MLVTVSADPLSRSPPNFHSCCVLSSAASSINQILFRLVWVGHSCPTPELVPNRAARTTMSEPHCLCLSRRLNRRSIQRNSRPHARTQIATFDVFPFRYRRLCLNDAGDQRSRIVNQFVRR